MRSLTVVLLFVLVTIIGWGVYGPVLHHGQEALGEGEQRSLLRPFLCVGVAYFLIAVLVPVAWLWMWGEKGSWTMSGALWSLVAGSAGALGALGIILAFKFRGSPLYVMPLVFGGAPVVNTVFTMWMNRTFKEASAIFYLGVLLVAAGAGGLLWNQPKKAPATPVAAVAESDSKVDITEAADGRITVVRTRPLNGATETLTWGPNTREEFAQRSDLAAGNELLLKQERAHAPKASLTFTEALCVGLSILLTVASWGCYGPVLHTGQMKMGGSRLRPLLCVGLAYFAIAVIVPLMALGAISEPGGWNFWGISWSLAGGAAGAIGALGIILAFTAGGKPIYVMPLVFGGAPVVNTFVSIAEKGLFGHVSTLFLGSLAIVVAGAAVVLTFAPKGHVPPPNPATKPAAM